jgi:hypothetical protein
MGCCCFGLYSQGLSGVVRLGHNAMAVVARIIVMFSHLSLGRTLESSGCRRQSAGLAC